MSYTSATVWLLYETYRYFCSIKEQVSLKKGTQAKEVENQLVEHKKITKRCHERITKIQEINNTYLTKIIILFDRNAKKGNQLY